MWPATLTRHAKQRQRQRGIKQKTIDIVIAYADIDIPANRGCRFSRISNRVAGELMRTGEFTAQEIDGAKRLMVLMNPSGHIITLVKVDPLRRLRWRH